MPGKAKRRDHAGQGEEDPVHEDHGIEDFRGTYVEYLRHADTDYLDAADLARQLERLAGDPEQLLGLAAEAASEWFTWMTFAKRSSPRMR